MLWWICFREQNGGFEEQKQRQEAKRKRQPDLESGETEVMVIENQNLEALASKEVEMLKDFVENKIMDSICERLSDLEANDDDVDQADNVSDDNSVRILSLKGLFVAG